MSKFSDLVNGGQLVLIDFFAEWCGPCKMMKPILEEVKMQMGDSITIIKIDAEKNMEVASAFQIQAYPTLVLVKEGKILWRQSGVLPAPEIVRQINANI